MTTEWEHWCRRHGVDPNTPDETLLDDYLHGRVPGGGEVIGWRDEEQARFYAGWSCYLVSLRQLSPEGRAVQARAEVIELERMARL